MKKKEKLKNLITNKNESDVLSSMSDVLSKQYASVEGGIVDLTPSAPSNRPSCVGNICCQAKAFYVLGQYIGTRVICWSLVDPSYKKEHYVY